MSELHSCLSALREVEAKRLRDLKSTGEEFARLQKTVEPHEQDDLRLAWRDDVGNIDREATIETLQVLQKILRLVGGEESHPVTRLIWALWDLRDGHELSPILRSQQQGSGRPPISTSRRALRASIAAGVRREEQKIGNTDDAAKRIFTILPEFVKLALSDDSIDWKTLRAYRWEVASVPASEIDAVYNELYKELLNDEHCEDGAGFSPI